MALGGLALGDLATPARAAAYTITTFDPAGSISTMAAGIDNAGEVVGSFINGSFVTSGFTYQTGGAATAFSVPGATSTQRTAINTAGTITGYSSSASSPPASSARRAASRASAPPPPPAACSRRRSAAPARWWAWPARRASA